MNMRAHLFGYRVKQLRSAYEAARATSDRQRVRLERDWEELERKVAAGRAAYTEEDEDGQVIYDRGEEAGEMMAEIEGILRLVREAFTISLHHLWERELTAAMRVKRYDPQKAISFLKSKGMVPDEIGLTILRLAANVAKHSEGRSTKQLYELRPSLFDVTKMNQYKDVPSYEYLRITDEIIDGFFDVVQKSGPQARPWSRSY